VFGGVGDEDRAVDEESATAFAATAAGSATVAASGRCRTLADSGVLAAARIDAGAGAGGRGNDGSVVPTALVATALALITRGLVRRRRWRV
jgi:hypothetical protein